MRVRKATEKDLSAVYSVEESCFEDGVKEDREVIRERLEKFAGGFLVAEDEKGRVVGYSSAEKWREVPNIRLNQAPAYHEMNGRIYYINSLGVAPALQGKGYGFKLLVSQVENAKKERCKKVIVITFPSEEHDRFFSRYGFKRKGEVANFFEKKKMNGVVYEYKI